MRARIAHNLGRGVKPHGLGIEQRAGENARMMAFDPGAGIDQQRKAGRVAFGKPVRAEAFDLGKAALCKIVVIAVAPHAAQKAVFKFADIAVFFKRGKGAAQPVGLIGGKAGADDGDLHRLFLKQRHAQGFAQNLAQCIRRKRNRFFAVAPPDIGMHHIALDRSGAHDGHFDHQIIKAARPHAGQKIHLCAAFHLKHPDAVGPAQHIIGFGILGRQRA